MRLSSPVTLIDHAGPRVRVTTPQGDISARAVLVAAPPGVIANETLRFAPALPRKLAAQGGGQAATQGSTGGAH